MGAEGPSNYQRDKYQLVPNAPAAREGGEDHESSNDFTSAAAASASGGVISAVEVSASSYPWRSEARLKTRTMKIVMFDQFHLFPVLSRVLACVEIQRVARGMIVRRRILAKCVFHTVVRPRQQEDALTMDAYQSLPPRGEATLRERAMRHERVVARCRAVLRMGDYTRWIAYQKYDVYYIAATLIARTWRDLKEQKQNALVRSQMQSSSSKRPPIHFTREDAAAAKIQRRWQSHLNHQIYRFYAQLIRFRESGDAALMLRCINPGEAGLIDGASQLHVRFRLAGEKFPPAIVYKIFTHAPVCDLGALAPRDYTAERSTNPKDLHSKRPPPAEADRSKWYRRQDRNPWRLINSSALENAEAIVAEQEAAKKDVIAKDAPYHWSRLQRREDKVLKQKRRKREWMMKMYTQNEEDVVKQVADAAAGQTMIDEETGEEVARPVPDAEALRATIEAMEDEQLEYTVNQLVDWAANLDFDGYQAEWQSAATAIGP